MEETEKPFNIRIDYQGETRNFTVTPIEEHFRIMEEDKYVADLLPNEIWYQMQTPLIEDDLADAIATEIDHHYD